MNEPTEQPVDTAVSAPRLRHRQAPQCGGRGGRGARDDLRDDSGLREPGAGPRTGDHHEPCGVLVEQPPEGTEVTDEEYLRFLEKRYRALAPAAPAGAPPDPAAMEEAVLARVELAPEALKSLRQERAEAARAKLVAFGVDAGRLFLTEGGERAKKEAGARVYFTLK